MKRDLRKVETAVLLGLFLLSGLLIALPAMTAFGVSAYSPAPAAVTGATAAIDYPIIAGVQTGPTAASRVITINNPPGNPSITTITISVPAPAVSAAPTGFIPGFGGVPGCTSNTYGGVTGCEATVFGSGPYSLQYQNPSSPGTNAVLPGGASISVVIILTPETTVTSTTGTDQFSLAVSVSDTTGANTVLSSMPIYETATTTTLTVTGSAISTAQTAGTPFTVSASSSASGLPLAVYATGRTNSITNAPAVTFSPASFTSGTGATSVSVNDTVEEQMSVRVGGPITYATSHASSPLLSGFTEAADLLANATTPLITINAGTLSQLTVKVNGDYAANANQVNITSFSTGIIPAASIVVTTTDKYGNLVTSSGSSTVTLTAITAAGQQAVFTSETAYTGTSYPYTPASSSSSLTASVSLTGGTGSPTLNYYVGPNYGSRSYISGSASSGLSGTSLNIVTFAFSTALSSMGTNVTQSASTNPAGTFYQVAAGKAINVTSTLSVEQAGVPMYFQVDNSSVYAGTFVGGATYVQTTSVASATGPSASAILSVATTAGNQTNVLGGLFTKPGSTGSNDTLTYNILTIAGSAASLKIHTFFDSGTSEATSTITTSGDLYLNIGAADAYGNTVTETSSNTVQVTISASSGALSTSTAYIGVGDTTTVQSGYTIQFVAPSATGTSTISASAVYNGVLVSGSKAISVVGTTPALTVNPVPSTITTGIPQSITGYANASAGIYNNVISVLEYSLNGATNQTLPSGLANQPFTITATFAASNIVSIYAKDSAGHWASQIVNVPPLTPATTFTNTSAINKITFTNGPQAINATFVNNSPTTYTVIVVGQVYQNQGGTLVPLSPPISSTLTNVLTTTQASAYLLLQGYAPGTYQVKITVYSLEYITYSTPITLTVTVS